MADRTAITHQFAVNVREAEAALRSLGACIASVDVLVHRTREAITESRRLLQRADTLPSRQ